MKSINQNMYKGRSTQKCFAIIDDNEDDGWETYNLDLDLVLAFRASLSCMNAFINLVGC